MRNTGIDPDRDRRDDSSYWAAALVLAIKNRNHRNVKSARKKLRRLGFDVLEIGDTTDATRVEASNGGDS